MFKEHLVFIHVPIASVSITSIVVDQHLIVVLDNEPIEEVDLEALNIVMDIPREGQRGRVGLLFHMAILSTCKSMSMIRVIYQIILPIKKPLLVLNPTSGLMQ